MLNKLIKAYLVTICISAIQQIHARLLIMSLAVMLLPACSVTQSNLNTEETSTAFTSEHKASFESAVLAMKDKKFEQAQSLLVDLINSQPNFANAHVNMGIIFLNNNSLYEAENSFNRALKIDPDNIQALNQLGVLYRQQGNFSDSKSMYEKAIDINSEYVFAHLNLGILYDLYLSDIPKAIKQYKKYQELTKDKGKLVSKWIIELERRHKKSLTQR